MKEDKNIQVFFTLLRAGLWEQADASLNDKVDWEKVYQLAEEQSVIGVVLAGIEKTNTNHSDNTNRIPQELLLQWIGEVQMIEQQNKAMNVFVAKLIEKLRKDDVYAILVKGQGIAQCYEKPLWRASGDVDLLLNEEYNAVESVFRHIAMGRRCWLNSGSHDAATNIAFMYSLYESCRKKRSLDTIKWRKVQSDKFFKKSC